MALLQCKRIYSSKTDDEKCKQDANKLYHIGAGNWSAYIEIIYNIFATRSPRNLNLIYEYYRKLAGKGLLSTVYSEFKGNTGIILETILKGNLDPYSFYAKRIHDSIITSNYCDLIRNICSKQANGLNKIRHTYKKKYNSDLLNDVQKLYIKNYNDIICSLIYKAK